MRLQYVAVVAVATLAATANGLQVAPDSAKSTSLRASADVRYPPYVEGKEDRLLISEVIKETPTEYEFSALEEDDDEYEDDSGKSDSSTSDDNERLFRRKKKKRKKSKETETPTPTPTPTGTETPYPTGTGTPQTSTTPAPTTRTPAIKRFVAWLKRVFGD